MKCTDKERETCNIEKMGCEGCYYNEDNDRDIEEFKILFYSDKLTQYGKRKFIEYYEQRIKACKELEYKYNKALSDLVQAEHKNKELEEKWDKDTHKLQNALDLANADKINNYIPVSLVEETIEEYKNKIDKLYNQKVWNEPMDTIYKNRYVNYINILQELLEKRK